jgi:hypothetical protein
VPPQLKILEIAGYSGDKDPTSLRVGQTFDLVKDRVFVGRNPENDIPLFGFDKARHRGQFVKVGEDYTIEDFPETRCRTRVNNSPIEGRTFLRDGDILTIYSVKLLYRT